MTPPVKNTQIFKTVGDCPIQADVYRVPGDQNPAILWLHGGMVMAGSRADLPRLQLERYLQAGLTVVSADYRLAPETQLPDIVPDLQDVFTWMHTTGPNGRRSYEFMRIADTPEGMSYFASPAGRPPVEFRFREAGDKRVVFENAAHDYPQRIVYWKDGDLLAARIEGTVRGQKRSEEWRMAPVAPVAGGGSGG